MKIRLPVLPLLFILCCFPFTNVNAQLEGLNIPLVDDIQVYTNRGNSRSVSNPASCTGDTIDYVRYKATAYNSISARTGSSLGQYYPVPKQAITISGFTFYSWSIDSVKVDIVCGLYKADSDSLPTGSALATDTMTLDSTFGAGLLSVLLKKCTFDTAQTIDFPYILTVEVIQKDRSAGVVANSWANGDGDKENLLCGSVSGTWYNGLNLNISGTTLDADMQFYPHVKYKLASNFKLLDSCYNPNDTVKFVNITRDSSVTGNKFYNRYLYYKGRYNNQYYENASYRWNYGYNNTNYTDVNGQYKYPTPGNYKVRLITTNYSYRSRNCIDTSYIDIKFKPRNPTLYGGNMVCEGDSFDIFASSINAPKYNWFYHKDSLPFKTGTSYNSGSVPITDTVYVKAYNGNCVSDFSTKIFNVYEIPDNPLITHDSVCTQSKANLSAKTNIGNIHWYSSLFGGTAFHTGEVYQTALLSGDWTAYVEADNNGCLSKDRLAVTAFVSSSYAPQAPTVTADTILCLKSAGPLNLKASVTTTDTLRWYDVPSGGVPIKFGNSHVYSTTGVGKKSFYIDAWDGTCASTREVISIETQDYPNFFKTTNDTICKGENGELIGYVFTGKTFWYNNATNGLPIDSGNVLTLTLPSTSTSYFAETKEGVCVSPTRKEIFLTVNTYAPLTELNGDQICSETVANLYAKVTSGTITWYNDSIGGSPLGTGNNFTSPVLDYTKNYYVSSSDKGCTSKREKITALVLKRPVAGFDYSLSWPGKVTCTPITLSGVSNFWDLGDGTTSKNTSINHTYPGNGQYNIMQVLTSLDNGCKDTSIVKLTIDFSDVKDMDKIDYELWPNPSRGNFTFASKYFTNNQIWEMEIINILGETVLYKTERPIHGKIQFSIEEKGVFFLTLNNQNQKIITKIIVE